MLAFFQIPIIRSTKHQLQNRFGLLKIVVVHSNSIMQLQKTFQGVREYRHFAFFIQPQQFLSNSFETSATAVFPQHQSMLAKLFSQLLAKMAFSCDFIYLSFLCSNTQQLLNYGVEKERENTDLVFAEVYISSQKQSQSRHTVSQSSIAKYSASAALSSPYTLYFATWRINICPTFCLANQPPSFH